MAASEDGGEKYSRTPGGRITGRKIRYLGGTFARGAKNRTVDELVWIAARLEAAGAAHEPCILQFLESTLAEHLSNLAVLWRDVFSLDGAYDQSAQMSAYKFRGFSSLPRVVRGCTINPVSRPVPFDYGPGTGEFPPSPLLIATR